MAIAEGESVPSVVTVWGGVSPPQPTKGSGEYRRKRILAYFEGHRMLLFVPMTKSGGGQFALVSPTPNSGGLVPPRDLLQCHQSMLNNLVCLALHT